jgi:hypothetical protein
MEENNLLSYIVQQLNNIIQINHENRYCQILEREEGEASEKI